jgi:hypothetical protein
LAGVEWPSELSCLQTVKVDGECMSQCPNGYLVYWAKQLGTILIMSALLRINSGTLNVHIAGATIARKYCSPNPS